MNIPVTDKAEDYVGLYVIDFGEQCAVGYTAEEVAILLESEEYADIKVYRIHRASPDGQMELAGVPHQRFQLESGMFFRCFTQAQARDEYRQLLDHYDGQSPRCRAKLHLARDGGGWLIGLIFPAECEQDMGRWLADAEFDHKGVVDAGSSQVTQYYECAKVIEAAQLWPASSLRGRDLDQLRAAMGQAFQR